MPPARRRAGAVVRGALALTCAANAACTPDEPAPLHPVELGTQRLSVDGSRLRDEIGREVTLRGVNAGGRSKLPPFFPFPFAESGLPEQAREPPFDAAVEGYVAAIADTGPSVVRVPFIWEAFEPTRGSYDERYLDRYVALAKSFVRHGVRVIVDVHQDVFARPLCGDGFPLWALPDPSMQFRDDCAEWYYGYFGDAEVDAAFDRFWSNEEGLRDSFEAMWRRLSARVAPLSGVVGFDLMNEPHPGTLAEAAWTRDVLGPFYARMIELVREQSPDALLFIEPSGHDAVDGATSLELPDAAGLVFELHYYAASVFMLGPEHATYDTDADLRPWSELRDAWNVPVLVGEFGCKTGSDAAAEYLSSNLRSLDSHRLHGTAWEYSTTQDDWNDEGYSVVRYGGEETPSARALVRAYPRAVAGRVVSFAFEPETRQGLVELDVEPGLSEIAAPLRLFPEGVEATLDGVDGRTGWDAAHGLLLVETQGRGRAVVRFGPR